jgi:hypothetical protein
MIYLVCGQNSYVVDNITILAKGDISILAKGDIFTLGVHNDLFSFILIIIIL